MKTSPTPSCTPRSGFTILELAVTVIIIAVIAVVALPMYKHAILKSRFSTVMPMAKAVADAQEIYYLGNNQYALGKEDLDIAPVEAENTQVSLSPAEEDEEYIYVAAHRTDIPNVRYIMYQKNSPKFAGNIHCEADANDEDALWLCEKALHGTEVTGSLQGKQYKTFLLAGDLGGSSFKVCPENAVCNDEGNVTGCADGYYQEEQTCKQEIACTGEQPLDKRLCQEAGTCGWETREVSCNYKTGEWIEPEWNTDGCSATPEPETRNCHDQDANTCGIQTQSYTCSAQGTWELVGSWQGSCTTAETVECGSTYSNPTAQPTREATCQTDGMWKYGEYDYTACGCTTADKPTLTEQCGSDYSNSTANKTRTVSCNGTTWGTPGNWNTNACGCTMSTKPGDYTTFYCPGKDMQGRASYTYVCRNGYWGNQVVSSTCTPVEPGGTWSEGECSSSRTSTACSGYTFDGATCVGTATNICIGNTYTNGARCSAQANSSCTGGSYSGSGTYCMAHSPFTNGCTGGTYEANSYCSTYQSTGCTGATFKAGSSCIVMGQNGTGGCTGTYKKGSWCSESSGGRCPAGTPVNSAGTQCWDGNGGKVAC